MASAWDCFGDDEPGSCAAPADARGDAHPFFVARCVHFEAGLSLPRAVERLQATAGDVCASSAAALAAACHEEAAACLQRRDAATFVALASRRLQPAGGGWGQPAWLHAFAACSLALAVSALSAGDAAAALARCDTLMLASLATDHAFDGEAGEADALPLGLRGVLGAVVDAALAALPPLPPPTWRDASRCGFQEALLPACRSPPVLRVAYASLSLVDFVNNFVLPCRPVVLTGCAASWPAMREWTFEALRAEHGRRIVAVEICAANDGGAAAHGRHHAMQQEQGQQQQQQHVPLSDVIDACVSGAGVPGSGAGVPYMSQHDLFFQLGPRFAAAIRVPRLLTGPPRAANVWLGGAGTVTHLHTDDAHNLLIQIRGVKRVRLFAAAPGAGRGELAAALGAAGHPRGTPGSPLNLFSNVDAAELDGQVVAGTPQVEATLAAGDALFIPRGAWHHVASHAPSISVNLWW